MVLFSPFQVRAIVNFAIKKIFLGLWESDKEWFWLFEPFSKLTTFSKHGTMIKIKNNITWLYKKYKVKIKWSNNNGSSQKPNNEVFIGLKHGSWYLLEENKHLLGESAKREIFLVLGQRMSKFLTSAGLLFILSPSRENPAIWFQFRPKLLNFTYLDSL